MIKRKKNTIIVRTGQRVRNKQNKTVYEIKAVKDNSIALLSEDGTECLLLPVTSFNPTDYEPVYN